MKQTLFIYANSGYFAMEKLSNLKVHLKYIL